MKRCMLAGVSVLVVLAPLAVGQPVTLLAQAIERSMYVSVVDEKGAPVQGLGPADFIVREDNASREVLRVVPASDPMQIAVLVDNSSAAEPMLAHVRRGLPPFIEALAKPTAAGRRNEIALVTLGSRPTILADYSTSSETVSKAVDRVWEETAQSGLYLLDGLIEVSQGFKKRESARPVIVVITSEGTELSDRHPDQVLQPLREAGAMLHVISIGRPSVGLTDAMRYRNQVVTQGPQTTGGTFTQLLAASALPAKLEQLADLLTKMYRVVYAHPDTLIPPERVTVAARRADLTAKGALARDEQAKR
jgi:hypothetical protein